MQCSLTKHTYIIALLTSRKRRVGSDGSATENKTDNKESIEVEKATLVEKMPLHDQFRRETKTLRAESLGSGSSLLKEENREFINHAP